MSKDRLTRITLTGGDGVHRKAMTDTSSRLMTFPDGVSRVITLRNAYWHRLDELRIHRNSPIEEMALNMARAYCAYQSFNEAAAPSDSIWQQWAAQVQATPGATHAKSATP